MVWLVLVFVTVGASAPHPVAVSSVKRSSPRALSLTSASAVTDARLATGVRYGAVDDLGDSLDTIKVVQAGPSLYAGVFHTNIQGTFVVKVATSKDILTWRFAHDLDSDASQPTIRGLSDGGYLVAYEKAGPWSHWLRFRHYPSLDSLLNGTYDLEADPTPGLSAIEGTPNIVSADLRPDLTHSLIKVGLHYNTAAGDREAVGTLTDFHDWSEKANDEPNRLLSDLGLRGNFGGRDHAVIAGAPVQLMEAQSIPGDWTAWRVYEYSERSATMAPLAIRTGGGSSSFGNPKITTVLGPDGHPAVVLTCFLFSEAAAPGEAGEMILYVTLPTS